MSLRGGHRIAWLRSAHGPSRKGIIGASLPEAPLCPPPPRPTTLGAGPRLLRPFALQQVACPHLHHAQRDSLRQPGRRCPGNCLENSASRENGTGCRRTTSLSHSLIRSPPLAQEPPLRSYWFGLVLVGFAFVRAKDEHRISVLLD